MKKRVVTIFLFSAIATALAGCAIRTASGPCYGFGCPSGSAATPQNAMNAGGGTAAAPNGTASAKAQDEKSRGFVAFVKDLMPWRHPTGLPPASTAPAPAAASTSAAPAGGK